MGGGIYAPGGRAPFGPGNPLQGGLRRAPSVGYEVGGPSALAIFATGNAALRTAVGCVLDDLAPADAPGLPLPGGSGAALKPPLVGGRGAPRPAPVLSGLGRPPGVAGRDLEPLELEGQGAHLLAQEESGRAGRHVVDGRRAEVRGTAGAAARPVVAARGSGRGNRPADEAGARPELEGVASAAQRVAGGRVVHACARFIPAGGRSVAAAGLGTGNVGHRRQRSKPTVRRRRTIPRRTRRRRWSTPPGRSRSRCRYRARSRSGCRPGPPGRRPRSGLRRARARRSRWYCASVRGPPRHRASQTGYRATEAGARSCHRSMRQGPAPCRGSLCSWARRRKSCRWLW